MNMYNECTHFTSNVYNYVHSMYMFLKESIQFCTFNIYNFSKNVHNSIHLKYTNILKK